MLTLESFRGKRKWGASRTSAVWKNREVKSRMSAVAFLETLVKMKIAKRIKAYKKGHAIRADALNAENWLARNSLSNRTTRKLPIPIRFVIANTRREIKAITSGATLARLLVTSLLFLVNNKAAKPMISKFPRPG